MFSISYLVYFFDIMDNTGKRFHAVIIHAVINAVNAFHNVILELGIIY